MQPQTQGALLPSLFGPGCHPNLAEYCYRKCPGNAQEKCGGDIGAGPQGYITTQFGFACDAQRFGCQDGRCIPDAFGTWSNPTCDATCQLPYTTTATTTAAFTTITTTATTTVTTAALTTTKTTSGKTTTAGSGKTTTASRGNITTTEGNITTTPGPTTGSRYSCSEAQCVLDRSGPWTSADCGRSCEAPPPVWPTVALSGCQPVGFDLGDEDVYPTYSQLVESNNDPSNSSAARLLSLVRLDYADSACTLHSGSDLVVGLHLEAVRPPSPAAGETDTPLRLPVLGGPGGLEENIVTVQVQNASIYIGNGWVSWHALRCSPGLYTRTWSSLKNLVHHNHPPTPPM